MFPLDLENTTFITLTSMYYYIVMSLCLKNVGVTYQCMMSHMFEPLLGKTMKVYIDDMLVKSKSRRDNLAHMREVFQLMRLYHICLNPNKCAFGIESGTFLSFLVSKRGIEIATGPSLSTNATSQNQEANLSLGL